MERGLQEVFQQSFAAYTKSRGVSLREYQAARHFTRCRTAALGGHKEVCPDGHFVRAHYHSCKHRSCPQCNAIQIERWLATQKAKLLDCPHHHIIFTIPHELIPLWLFNRAHFMNCLFKAVRGSLFELLSDSQYLGATPGMQLAFHSWGRDLSLHPHIHCLITDGGLDEHGEWQRPKRSHFLPARVLMRVFRGHFAKALHQGLERQELLPPTNDNRFKWHGLIKRVQRKKWNVNLQKRYDHGAGVVTYLSHYVRGGPISNHQLNVTDHQVQLGYYDHRLNPKGEKKCKSTQHFTHTAFIARYLQHVPEKGRRVIRSYGLYASGQRARLNRARACHHQAPVKEVEPLDWQTYMDRVSGGEDYRHCPECGQVLYTELIVRNTGPPRIKPH